MDLPSPSDAVREIVLELLDGKQKGFFCSLALLTDNVLNSFFLNSECSFLLSDAS